MSEMTTIEVGSTVEENGTEDVGIVYDVILNGQARTIHYKVLGEFFNPKQLYLASELDVLAEPSAETLRKVEEFLNPQPVAVAQVKRTSNLLESLAISFRNLFGVLGN